MTQKLVDKIDFKSTYLNVLTTGFVHVASLLCILRREKETIEMAVASLRRLAAKDLRLTIMPNTLHLENLFVSEALVPS